MPPTADHEPAATLAREESALACLKRGWSIVPVAERGKRPLVLWEQFQHARASAAEVGRWFRRWPNANVGVVTGSISGIIVLDVDAKHGGAASLRALEKRYAPLPETVTALSGGGGRHYYFTHPGSELHNRAGIAKGLDLRGDGGMIVAPPSIHPSGRPYAWQDTHAPDEIALARLPAWLLALARGGSAGTGHPLPYWRSLVRRGVGEGERNSTIASLAGHLLWHDVDPDVVLELLLSWNQARCRPPLSDDEVAQTVQSIVRTHSRAGSHGSRGQRG